MPFGITLGFRRRTLRRRALTLFKCKECCSREEKLSPRNADFEPPQTYGVSIAGREVLCARQVGGESGSGQLRMAKLFDLEKISNLRKAGTAFAAALPAHNPNDSAMVEVFATLPKPTK
jgi:hypothetical protein